MKEVFSDFNNFIYHSGININFTLLDNIDNYQIKKYNIEKFNIIKSLIILINNKHILFTNGSIFNININDLEIEFFKKIPAPNGTLSNLNDNLYLFKRSSQKIPIIINVIVLDNKLNILKKKVNLYDNNIKINNNNVYIKDINNLIYKYSKQKKLKLHIKFENNKEKNLLTKSYINNINHCNIIDFEYSDAVYAIINVEGKKIKCKLTYNMDAKINNIKFLLDDNENDIFVQEDKVSIEMFNSFEYLKGENLILMIKTLINNELDFYPLNNHCSHEMYNNLYERLNGFVCVKSKVLRIYNVTKNLDIENEIISLNSEELIPYKYPMSPYYVGTVPSIIEHDNKYFYYAKLRFTSHSKLIQYSISDDLKNWSKLKNINYNTINYNLDSYCIPNIFKYPGTKYLIGNPFNYKDNRSNIILSKNGIDFNDIYTMDFNCNTELPIVNNFFEWEDNHILLKCNNDKENLIFTKYILRKDSLFYIRSNGYGYLLTKLLKVYNREIIINYKCDESGYIIIHFLDKNKNKLDNNIILKNENIEYKIELDYEFVYLDINIIKSSIFSISGEFIDEKKKNNILQFTYAYFGKESHYQNKKLKLNKVYEKIVDNIIYSDDLKCAKIKVKDLNNNIDEIELFKSNKEFNIINVTLI